MANPQKENGYTPIANEIMDKLGRTRIPGEARQVLDVIIRKTYGYQKKSDLISLSQFVELTGLKKPNVVRAIQKLLDMRIIKCNYVHYQKRYPGIKSDTPVSKAIPAMGREYSLNKDFDTWLPSVGGIKSDTPVSKAIMAAHQNPELDGVSDKYVGGIKSDTPVSKAIIGGVSKAIIGGVSKAIHTKESITKERDTKESDTTQKKESRSCSCNLCSSSDKSDEPARRPKKSRTVALVDDEFLDSLKSNAAYDGIDVVREHGKLLAWLQTPRGLGKLPTRQRFINWLNRCTPQDKTSISDNVERMYGGGV